MSNTFFTSDIHFSHKNIIKFCPNTRPWQNEDEMNQAIIEYWQKTVGEQDNVWILGDACGCSSANYRAQVGSLHGNADETRCSRYRISFFERRPQVNIGTQLHTLIA